MPLPYVDSATITGNKIKFRVDVTDFKDSQGDIEVSGEASQISGAFVPIHEIVKVPSEPNGKGDDEGKYFVDVEADLTQEFPFRKDRDVTIFVRVSRVWVTVLGEQNAADLSKLSSEGEAGEGTTWNKLREVASIRKPSQASTGSDSTVSLDQQAHAASELAAVTIK